MAINVIDMPSVLQKKFSPSTRGERMAEKMMVTQEVEAMSIMLPRARATGMRNWQLLTSIGQLADADQQQSEEPLPLAVELLLGVVLDLDVADLHGDEPSGGA